MTPTDRRIAAVAAAFVAVAGTVWLALSVVLAALSVAGLGELWAEVRRVGGPPATVALAAGCLSWWLRRSTRAKR